MRKIIPNLLSLLRLVLIVPFTIALSHNQIDVLIALSLLIILTDYLDGRLARAWNAVSESGKIIDPLADKICTAVAAISLVQYRGFPLWLLMLIIARDIIILIAGLILIRLRKFIPVSDIFGRVAMGVMATCLFVYLLEFTPLKIIAAITTVVFLSASLAVYGYHFLQALSKRGE